MSEKGLTEGKETGTTNGGVTFDDLMHEAGEHRDKQEGKRACRSEEAMVLEVATQGMMLTDLPDACICLIVSYLSPKDVARSACVCQGFRITLDSDSVWDQLVPKTTLKVVGLHDELKSATKKKIFTFLCRPFLLRETLAYWLDQGTGVCYSVAAKGLRVVWGDDRRYWEWSPRPGARWPEVACLREVCWFHTSGNMKFELPPGVYTLSWRIQYETRTERSYSVRGWDSLPTEFTLSTPDGSQNTTSHRYLTNYPDNALQQNELDDLTPVRLVDDNWFEFDAGEVTVIDEGEATSLEFSMSETESGLWKSGILLDGVVLRPSSLARTIGRSLSVEELGESSLGQHQVHPEDLLDPRGRFGGRLGGPAGRVFPRRRGRVRLVQPNPPPFDAGEN